MVTLKPIPDTIYSCSRRHTPLVGIRFVVGDLKVHTLYLFSTLVYYTMPLKKTWHGVFVSHAAQHTANNTQIIKDKFIWFMLRKSHNLKA